MQKSHLDKKYNFALSAVWRLANDDAPVPEKVQALNALRFQLGAMIQIIENGNQGKGTEMLTEFGEPLAEVEARKAAIDRNQSAIRKTQPMRVSIYFRNSATPSQAISVELPGLDNTPEVLICGSQVFKQIGMAESRTYAEVNSYAILEPLNNGGALVTEITAKAVA